jgi:di/tricarboxylate transporter
MDWPLALTGVLLIAMFATLVHGRLAADIVLLGVLLALLVTGILTPSEAVVGFSNPGVITIAFLYVAAAGLKDSGAMTLLSERLFGRPQSAFHAQVRLALPVAGLSAFVNNTPLVAAFMPTLHSFARRHRIAASQLYLPLSYASILGGTCTLIGTSTNIVVSGLIIEHNRVNPGDPIPALGMFTLSWVGVPVAVAGLAYILLAGRRLLPHRMAGAEQNGEGRRYTAALRVAPTAPLVGRTIAQAGLRHLPGAFLAHVERGDETLLAVEPEQIIRAGDTLVFVGLIESVSDLQRTKGLVPVDDSGVPRAREQNRLIEVVISPASPLVGQSIRDGGFRTRYGAVVVAVRRHGERLVGKLGDIVLQPGDTLLLEAPPGFARAHRDSEAFYLVSEHEGPAAPRHDRALVALGIFGLLMVGLTLEVLDTMTLAMLAAAAMIAFRCTDGAQARAHLDWQVLIVIGAAFGIARAIEKTGLADIVATNLLGWAMTNGPEVGLAAVYGVTVLLTAMLTNNAAAVLVFPIVHHAVSAAGFSFLPFAVCIAVAASCEFASPIGYQTNLMVMGPGGYRWGDYIRFGLPLDVLCGVVAVSVASVAYGALAR